MGIGRYIDRKGNTKYVRPGGDYSWSPDTTIDKHVDKGETIKHKPICTAIAGCPTGPCSWDNVVTYVYDRIFIFGKEEHIAYVVCDYVE